MSTRASVLVPEPQSLFLPLVAATFLHASVLVCLLLGELIADWWEPKKPLIDPRETAEVSLIQIKGSDKMPTRETVAPQPKGEMEALQPPKPRPPRESDLTSPDARPQSKGLEDRSSEREELLKDLERRRMMEEALKGAKDREATDPSSKATETIKAGSGLVRADPELAKYMMAVQELFNSNFRPVQTIVDANPGIMAEYHIDFDPVTGRVIGWAPYKPSGIRSYDASVERAIDAVATVPLPPEKFKDVVGSRFLITFEPK